LRDGENSFLGKQEVNASLKGFGGQHALAHGDEVTLRVEEVGHGDGGNAVADGALLRCVKVDGEGVVRGFQESLGGVYCLLIAVGKVDHHKMDAVAVFREGFVKVRHLHLAGAAPAGPEVEDDRLAEKVGERNRIAVRIGDSEIGSGGIFLLRFSCIQKKFVV